MMTSDLLSRILPEDETTWCGKVFVTVDLDWADDEILANAVQVLDGHGLAFTLFATHQSDLVRTLASRSRCEIGIHPRIDSVLSVSDRPNEDPSGFGTLRAVFPAATSVRSHSLVQSSRLHNQFAACGFTHESNTYVPAGSGLQLRPWRIWNGLIRVPFAWADDIHLYSGGSPRDILGLRDVGLCVIAVHPIHLFLNTDAPERYERYKGAVRRGERIDDCVNRTRRGVRDAFSEIVAMLQ